MKDKLITEYNNTDVELKLFKRQYGEEYTNYTVAICKNYRKIVPIFGNATSDVYKDLLELAMNYMFKRANFPFGFAFIDPTTELDLEIPNEFEGEVFFNKFAALRKHFDMQSESGKLFFSNDRFSGEGILPKWLNKQVDDGRLRVDARGQDHLRLFTIHPYLGNLSINKKKGDIVSNAHFFIMEIAEMGSPNSFLGQPYGTLVTNGKVDLPPLYRRPVFFIDSEGKSHIKEMSVKDAAVLIDGVEYRNRNNCEIYMRPDYETTPVQAGCDFAIINRNIVSQKNGGGVFVPEGGFVLHVSEDFSPDNLEVDYRLPIEADFAVQVGPSLVENGVAITEAKGQYNHYENLVPPKTFATEWKNTPAPRIGIGEKDGNLIFIWAGGTNTMYYNPGRDNRGFTLDEMAKIFEEFGANNALNLDGGGSAQLLTYGGKYIKLGDRRGISLIEFERPTPVGIGIEI